MSDQEFEELALQNDDANKLTSDRLDDFRDAVDILYIKGNASGRRKFYIDWPQATALLFDTALITMDHDGAQDKQKRQNLENAAIKKQDELLQLLSDFEGKSVHEGLLQKDYVRSTVEQLGWDLSILFYSEKIVEKFLTPPPAPEDNAQEPTIGAQTPALDQAPIDQPLNQQALNEATHQPRMDVQGTIGERPDPLSPPPHTAEGDDEMVDVRPIQTSPAPVPPRPVPSTQPPQQQQIPPAQEQPLPVQPTPPSEAPQAEVPAPASLSLGALSGTVPKPQKVENSVQQGDQNQNAPAEEQQQSPPLPSLSLSALSGVSKPKTAPPPPDDSETNS